MQKKNPYYYLGANHTVDIVMVSPCEDKKVLMIVRSENAQACPGLLAFPGGFVDTEAKRGEYWKPGLETHEQAALRELKEETGTALKNIDLSRFFHIGVYEGKARDPRDNEKSWSRSSVFYYQLNQEEFEEIRETIVGLDDAAEALWIPMEDLKKNQLAFDHNKILEDVSKFINNKLEQKTKIKRKL